VLLGVFEAGFFPALAFIIQTWYKRDEVQKRLAGFYLISIVLGGFSAILAYGFQLLRGKGGLNGWRWIFLLEGIITVVVGILTWLFVPDFPDRNRFLNTEDTKMIMDRVEADRGDSVPDAINLRVILKHLSDPFLWSFCVFCFFHESSDVV
jgi:MFS family permease